MNLYIYRAYNHKEISAIIYLEKRKDETALREAIDKVIDLIKEENIIEIRIFTTPYVMYNWNSTKLKHLV